MANLPPQLERTVPEPAAASIGKFSEMAPGIPWSNQTLDDMLETLRRSHINTKVVLSPPLTGITRIESDLFTQRTKKEWKSEIFAVVDYYCGRGSSPGYPEHPAHLNKTFPMDRTGLKQAIEYLQSNVQNVKRRGLCETCLAEEPPMKRLRVGGNAFCSKCVLQKAVFE